ncbi:MAG: hypothetical protein LRY55_14255, partial [Leadbetterella sp.]|nr:hypothetical protein [Leadbetterella sp.]
MKKKQQKYENTGKRKGVKASVKLLAACQDHQVTYDGKTYGIFTEALSRLLRTKKTAEQLIAAVRKSYGYPRPNFFQYGSIIPSFDSHHPFMIEIKNAGIVTGYREPDLGPYNESDSDENLLSGDIDRNAVLLIESDENGLDTLDPGSGIKIIKRSGGRKLLV